MEELQKRIRTILVHGPTTYTTDDRLDMITQEITTAGYVKAADLMQLGDIAKFFDVGLSTAGNWRDRHMYNGMPLPVAQLSGGAVWDGAAVLEWWINWKPRPRGGPKAGSLPWDRETADS